MQHDIPGIISKFAISAEYMGAAPYGNGHINDTYAVQMKSVDGGSFRVLLQRINHHVFRDPAGLMKNIVGITEYLKNKIIAEGGDPMRETLTVIPTQSGEHYTQDESGNYWRVYVFIEDAITHQQIRDERDFYQCGASFGHFQQQLADYDTSKLIETIPDFHHTVKRFAAFRQALEEDRAGRAALVKAETEFVLRHEEDAGALVRLLESGQLPWRVTHNDTKLNNIMIDTATGKAICVIDLDTVMPGAAAYDFGDSIRFGATTGAEDEPDLSKVNFSLRLFEVFAKGYLSVASRFLNELELWSLAVGSQLMTFECGMRFLTDYLNGDTYFKIHREHQNLDRCRTQFKLVSDMEAQMDAMQKLVHEIAQTKDFSL